jgi:hypothetical protein
VISKFARDKKHPASKLMHPARWDACRTLIFPGGAHSPNIQATVRLKADRIKQFELSPQKTNKK